MFTDPSSASIRVEIGGGVCVYQIAGAVANADGNGIPNTRVQAAGDDSGAGAQTAADGTFTITVPSAGSYILSMNIDGCTVYYSTGGATGIRNEAVQVQVSDSDVEGLRFQLSGGVCSTTISGQLLDADGNGIPNTRVQAAGDDSWADAQTAADGTFTITVPSAGSYRLSMNIDGCAAYYRPDGATGSRNEATQVQVSDSDVEELRFQLSGGVCSTTISGQLLDAEGNGIPNTWVSAGGDGARVSAQTAADGTFTITVPSAGSYILSMNIDGCTVYYSTGGATLNPERSDPGSGVGFRCRGIAIPAVRGDVLDYDQRSAVGRRGQWHSQYVGKGRR